MSENVVEKSYTLTVLPDKNVWFIKVDHDAKMVYCSLDMERTVLAFLYNRAGMSDLRDFLRGLGHE